MLFLSLFLAQYGSSIGHESYLRSSSAPEDLTGFGLLLILLCALLSFIVQQRMQSTFRTFSTSPAPLTGAEVAHRMLADNGLSDVRVTCVQGQLTDHYNPLNRTVNLSETVYHTASVASMAVAAHECGHAVQHARAYPWLGMRSSLVPIVQLGATFGQWILLAGLIMLSAGAEPTVAWIGLACYASTTLFAFITLPVEFDASRRALAWLRQSDYSNSLSRQQAGKALRWAAMTYVVAALSSLAMLLYYAAIILRNTSRRD